MKNRLIIFILFFCTINIVGQTEFKYDYTYRYKFTRKAKRNFKRGNLVRAEKFIKKTRQCSFGFCGVWDVSEMDFMEVQILNKQQKFDESLKCLDSMKYSFKPTVRDSFKVVTLFLKFGKEKVKQAFEKVNKFNPPDPSYDSSYWVFLDDLNYRFWFAIPDDPYYWGNNRKAEQVKTGNEFYDSVKDLPFYKLLQ